MATPTHATRPLHILLASCDWRDVVRANSPELLEKLRRDRLEPDRNRLTMFTWAAERYRAERGNIAAFGSWAPTRFKPILDLLTLVRLPFFARRHRADAVATYDYGFLPAAWLAAKLSGAKCLLLVNNMPARYSRARRFGWIKGLYSAALERLFSRLPDAVMTINPAMRDYLVDVGVPAERIAMFSMDTIARDASHIAAAKPGRIRAALNLPEGARLVLAVARLELEKGYPRLIECFAGTDSRYHLVIAGEGSLRPSLEAAIEKFGLAGRVHLLGNVTRDRIWDCYLDADCFCLLSREEALGVVFWEAMHANVPVVGSEAPGIIESIGADESRGLLFTSAREIKDFPAVIAEAIDGSRRAERVAAARRYVDEMTANALTVNDVVAPRARRLVYLYSRAKDRADFAKIAAGEMHDGDLFGLLRLRELGYDADFLQIEDVFPAGFCRWLRRHVSIHFIHLPLLLSPKFWRAEAVVSGGALGLLVARAALRLCAPRWVAIDFNLAGTVADVRTLRERVLAWGLGRTSAVVCIAEAEILELAKRAPRLAGRLSFAHEGVDLTFFSPDSATPREPRLGCSVGADRGRDFALVVAAAADAGVRLEIAAPERHVAKLGQLPEGVSARPRSHREVRDLCRRASFAAVILKPTGPADSMGTLAVVEAMASGLPVVATDTPSVRSYVEDGVSGLLVPEGDRASLAAAFRQLAADPARAAAMGDAARRAAEASFGAERFAGAIAAALDAAARPR